MNKSYIYSSVFCGFKAAYAELRPSFVIGWESWTFVNIVLWYARGEGLKWSAWGEVWAVLFKKSKKQSSEVNWAHWSKVDGRDTLHTVKELEHKQPQFVNETQNPPAPTHTDTVYLEEKGLTAACCQNSDPICCCLSHFIKFKS